jgi:hypothetical protein
MVFQILIPLFMNMLCVDLSEYDLTGIARFNLFVLFYFMIQVIHITSTIKVHMLIDGIFVKHYQLILQSGIVTILSVLLRN